MHSADKAASYEDAGSERSAKHSLWGSASVSRDPLELLRLKDRAMDNTKEGITIADCRQVHAGETGCERDVAQQAASAAYSFKPKSLAQLCQSSPT